MSPATGGSGRAGSGLSRRLLAMFGGVERRAGREGFSWLLMTRPGGKVAR